ncbi:AI-2E family transporter [Micromonospora sp. MS34]|uniref:AI-2E family transporter n=1 Tax=Micromonospora sp. MS34 TaxID=3385971 RepID=UPI0039A16DD8
MSDEPTGPVSGTTVFGRAIAATGGVVLVGLGCLVVYAVRTVLVQALIGLFIAISLDPPVRAMVRRGVRRGLAVTVIVLAALAVLIAAVAAFVPPLVAQGSALTADFPRYLADLRADSPWLARLDDRFQVHAQVAHWLTALPGRDALGYGQRFMGALSSAFLVAVLTVYLMLDLPRLRARLVSTSPRRHRRAVESALTVVTDKVGAYMIGNIVISVIAGGTSFVALTVLGVPFAFPLAVVVALTDLIPMVGATLGATICVVVALATTDVWPHATALALFFVLYQQVENYLLVPRVMRDAVQLPALAVLLAALIGGALLGLIGALMAIPLAAAVKAVVATVAVHRLPEQSPVTGPDSASAVDA